MKRHRLKATGVAMLGLACIAGATLGETPPPPQQWATGWFSTYLEQAYCPEGCPFWWDNPVLWEFKGMAVPVYEYPQTPIDDAYLSWDGCYEGLSDLIVELTQETIDAFVVRVTAPEYWLMVTFESREVTGNSLSCDHLTLEAYENDAYFKATDNAEVRTVG